MGAGSLYVVSCTIIQMVSRGFTSREFAGQSSFGIKLANPSDTMLAWSVHCLFLFKAFQLFLVTYPHSIVLETLIDNVRLKFFLTLCMVEILRIYLQLFRQYFSNILWKKGHPLLGLSSKVFDFEKEETSLMFSGKQAGFARSLLIKQHQFNGTSLEVTAELLFGLSCWTEICIKLFTRGARNKHHLVSISLHFYH